MTFGDATSPTNAPWPTVALPAASTLCVAALLDRQVAPNHRRPAATLVDPEVAADEHRSAPALLDPHVALRRDGPAPACVIETSRPFTTPTSARSTVTSPAASTVFKIPCSVCTSFG